MTNEKSVGNNVEGATISILHNEGIEDVIEARGIKEGDFPLIEELATFDKNLLIENFHNFFTFEKENSVATLDRMILKQTKEGDSLRRLCEIAKHFVSTYDWMAAWHLFRAIENLPKKK